MTKQTYTIEKLLWAIQEAVSTDQENMHMETVQSIVDMIIEHESEIKEL